MLRVCSGKIINYHPTTTLKLQLKCLENVNSRDKGNSEKEFAQLLTTVAQISGKVKVRVRLYYFCSVTLAGEEMLTSKEIRILCNRKDEMMTAKKTIPITMTTLTYEP